MRIKVSFFGALIGSAFFLLMSCGSEGLTGTGAQFAGYSKSRTEDNTTSVEPPSGDANSTLPGPQDEEPASTAYEPTKDVPIDTIDTTVSEVESPCIERPVGVSSVLDFDTPPLSVAAGTQANMIITNQFAASHGVKFSVSAGHDAVIRRTSRANEPQIPAAEEAWMCILCQGSPSRNRLLDAAAEQSVGRFVLSTSAAAANASAELRIDYLIKVASLNFDLIDVDGSEVWLVEVFDAAGNIVPAYTQSISEAGYDLSRTGNGAPTRISIKSSDGAASIAGFLIRGEKPSQRFGFAFDNFETGIPSCRK